MSKISSIQTSMLAVRPSIAINASMLDDKPTGVGVYTTHLINELNKNDATTRGYDITTFSPTHNGLTKQARLAFTSKWMLSSRYGKRAAVYRVLWNVVVAPLRMRRHHLVLCPTTHGNPFSTRQILTVHDVLSLRFKKISRHQRLYFSLVLPLFLKNARSIITVSESTKQDLVSLCNCPPDKIFVVPNGYDTTRYQPVKGCLSIKEKFGVDQYILALGPTYPHKNFERLLDAFAALPITLRAQHKLVIGGGKNPYLAKLKNDANSMGLGADVVFIDYVPIELMASLYSNALMLVFPSLYEGFGIPLLEAMACGCPVITSACSSMPEVCGPDASYYINPYETASMTKAMLDLIKNMELREQLRLKGLERVKQFSWERTAQQVNAIIKKELSMLN